jgi:hypothetical protein
MARQSTQSDQGTPPATPRWVKVVGAVVVLLILLVIIALVAGGEHGPGRHVSSGEAQPALASAEPAQPR